MSPARWIVEEVFQSETATLVKIAQIDYLPQEEWPKVGQELIVPKAK